MVVRHAHLHALSQEPTYRVGYSIGCSQAVQLVVRDAYDRPAHRHQRVRPSRIPDTAFLPFVHLPALVLHVEFRIRPAKVATKTRSAGSRAGSCDCLHLVIHPRDAQTVPAVRCRQAQHERLLRLPRRSRTIRQVRQDARHDPSARDGRVERNEAA